MNHLSRRGFIKTLGVSAGALIGTRLGGQNLLGLARAAAPESTCLVVVYLNGGFNAIFSGADALTNTAYGVTANNATALGGVVLDNTLVNAIPMSLRNRVASVGINHGISGHEEAQSKLFMADNVSGPLMLANAIGGTGAIKAAVVGDQMLPNKQMPAPVNNVSLQPITDMKATIEAIAGATPSPNTVDRDGAAKGLVRAQAMSKQTMAKNLRSLATLDQGYASAVATLQKPVQPFSVAEFNAAYNLKGAAIDNFPAKLAAAELMVRSGANFVIAQDEGWDQHDDITGTTVRNMMSSRIAPSLNTFLSRVVEGGSADRNVIVAVFGDFHRSIVGTRKQDGTGTIVPDAGHQANLAAVVIGKTLKNATTGKTDAKIGFPAGTPGIAGFWQLLAAAARVDTNPFGPNPHPTLLA